MPAPACPASYPALRHSRPGICLLTATALLAFACSTEVAATETEAAAEPAASPALPGKSPASEEAVGDATPAADVEPGCNTLDVPDGMACIPAGPAIIGADDRTPPEKPQHEVQLSLFFIDLHEVSNAKYNACVKAGACPKRGSMPKSYTPYLADDRPAIPISWHMAHAFCAWADKRLPTEAEWEKVARAGAEARTYPWGDAPSCDNAAYKGCKPRRTRDVGSFPAGPYGVFDMAGNGYEWVNDWQSACYDGCAKACGDACTGADPQGPCDGAATCKGRRLRVLKGGSWYWPADQMRGAWRRFEKPKSGLHRLSFRCAASPG